MNQPELQLYGKYLVSIEEGKKSLGSPMPVKEALHRHHEHRRNIVRAIEQYEGLNGKRPPTHTYHTGDGIYVTISVIINQNRNENNRLNR